MMMTMTMMTMTMRIMTMKITSLPCSGIAALSRTQAPVSSLVMFRHLFTLMMTTLTMMTSQGGGKREKHEANDILKSQLTP